MEIYIGEDIESSISGEDVIRDQFPGAPGSGGEGSLL